jgi:glycosyltransferase involved in cell wall biosynthesis
MRVAVITPVYTLAGVPLAQERLARALAENGHTTDFLIGHISGQSSPSVVPGLKITVLKRRRVLSMLIPLIHYFLKVRPNIVFSAEDHLTIVVILACLFSFSKAKISGSSRVPPLDSDSYSERLFTKGWLMKLLMKSVMWRANALTCVSRDLVPLYHSTLNTNKHCFAYNIIKTPYNLSRANQDISHVWFSYGKVPVVVSAGALHPAKGCFDLVRAISLVRSRFNIRLLVLGDGSAREGLRDLIDLLGLSESVCLLGNVDNPLAYFSRCQVFVLASYSEGLPNVLVEAMMCGCTPVATDCPTGPREVLEDGKYGYLVPVGDVPAIAFGIEQALVNPITKDLLNEAVRPFEAGNVIRRHSDLLDVEL